MEVFLLFARLILALIFGIAGIAKLLDQSGSEKAAVDFGAPRALAKPLAFLLPLAEILIAILLLPLATAWLGGLAALILLLAFVSAVLYNLARGKAPDCHCFGQIHSEPVGAAVLIRNLVLASLAMSVVMWGRERAGLSTFDWLAALSSGEMMQLVLGIAIVALLATIVVVLRKIAINQIILLRQIEFLGLANQRSENKSVERESIEPPKNGLPIGAIAPDFKTTDIAGKKVTFEHLLMRGKPIFLLFTSATCAPCAALLPQIDKWLLEMNNKITVALVSTGTAKANKEKFGAESNGKIVLNQHEREISALFRAAWTPSAILINADGTIASALTTGDTEINQLFDKTRAALSFETNGNHQAANNFYILPPATSGAPRAGDAAPDFTLQTLGDNQNVRLEDFRGVKTLLLMWRATCPYCQKILADFKKWEAVQRDFKVLVVAADEPEAVLAKEFKSTVVLERDLELNKKIDNKATPAALIIDENGKIASDIARGAEEIFALVGYRN